MLYTVHILTCSTFLQNNTLLTPGFGLGHRTTPWPSWLRRETVNLEIVSSILTGVVHPSFFLLLFTLPTIPKPRMDPHPLLGTHT